MKVIHPQAPPQRRLYESDWSGPLVLLVVVAVWVAGIRIGFERSLAITTLLGLGTAIVGVFLPSLGLLGVGLLCTTDTVTRVLLMTGGLLRFNTLNYWLVAMVIICLPVALRSRSFTTRMLYALILLMTLQLSYAPDLRAGLISLLNVISVLGILAYVFRGSQDPRAFAWLGLINGTLGAIGGLLYFLQFSSLPELNYNVFSYFPLTALFSICLAIYSSPGRFWMTPILASLALLNGGWVFLSTSRGGMLVASLCLLFIFFGIKQTYSRFVFVAVVPLILAVGASLFNDRGEKAAHRVGKLFSDEYSLDAKTSGRSEIVQAAWFMFTKNPFGVGTGGFNSEFESLELPEMAFAGMSRNAHSAWLKVLIENGVVGFVFMAAFVASFALSGWSLRNHPRIFPLGLLITVALSANYLSREFQAKGPWLLAAAGIVIIEHIRQNSLRADSR